MSLSPENKALIERVMALRNNLGAGIAERFPETLNDLLDAARQEGARGGEPVALREADVAYLVRLVERDLPSSHVGEGTLDRRDREAAEQRAAAIKLALYASPAEPSGWRPIEEIEPKDGECLIVATADNPPVVGEAWWREDYDGKLNLWWAGTGPGDYHADPIDQCNQRVTHGRPLPLPPTSEGGGA